MPLTASIQKIVRKLRRKRPESHKAHLQPLLNIKIVLLTWAEDQDRPLYSRRSDSEAKINNFLRNYTVVRYHIPTRDDPDDIFKETAEFLEKCEQQLEPHTYLLVCYVGRHAHYTHGYDLQPVRYDPDAFHWNDVMRMLETTNLGSTILRGPAAETTGLEFVLEYENRVSPKAYRKTKNAHRDIPCLGALHKGMLPTGQGEPHRLRHMAGAVLRPCAEEADRVAVENLLVADET